MLLIFDQDLNIMLLLIQDLKNYLKCLVIEQGNLQDFQLQEMISLDMQTNTIIS